MFSIGFFTNTPKKDTRTVPSSFREVFEQILTYRKENPGFSVLNADDPIQENIGWILYSSPSAPDPFWTIKYNYIPQLGSQIPRKAYVLLKGPEGRLELAKILQNPDENAEIIGILTSFD